MAENLSNHLEFLSHLGPIMEDSKIVYYKNDKNN